MRSAGCVACPTFAGSTLDKCDIRMLNPQAALVDALWLRRDQRSGQFDGTFWRDFTLGMALTSQQDGASLSRSQHRRA